MIQKMEHIQEHKHEDCGCSTDNHEITAKEVQTIVWQPFFPAGVAFILLVAGIYLNRAVSGFSDSVWSFTLFFTAYIIVGRFTILKAFKRLFSADIFNEFFLMTLATAGAFAIGQYAEAVAVMLFYETGELFNSAAVKRARRSIKALLDMRPETVTVLRERKSMVTDPKNVSVGEIIRIKPGERVALDGILLSETAFFNSAVLTGEAEPVSIDQGQKVLAGMINEDKVSDIKVTSEYENSALARILYMVQESLAKKAKTELFVSKLARVYTPVVFFLAVAVTFLPYFFVSNYQFSDWFYRGLIFLVISCPCALVISIPLGYFGGIGAASKNGILFKGSNFLDTLTSVNALVLDKTGTITKGVYQVKTVRTNGIPEESLVTMAAALEKNSTHPVAKTIVEYAKKFPEGPGAENVQEIPGLGLKGTIKGSEVLAGNLKLFKKFHIPFDTALATLQETLVAIAVNGDFKGYFLIEDEIRSDSFEAIRKIRAAGIEEILMLSGDKESVVQNVAAQLSISEAYGNLLPEDKVRKVEELKKAGKTVAFVGDGINDAPVIALSDVGIAMGEAGSAATIETADVVLQSAHPSKIAQAMRISAATRKIVWQNIFLALGIKGLVLTLGAFGDATLWEAVFADVGVALLAILNAVRIQKMDFR